MSTNNPRNLKYDSFGTDEVEILLKGRNIFLDEMIKTLIITKTDTDNWHSSVESTCFTDRAKSYDIFVQSESNSFPSHMISVSRPSQYSQRRVHPSGFLLRQHITSAWTDIPARSHLTFSFEKTAEEVGSELSFIE